MKKARVGIIVDNLNSSKQIFDYIIASQKSINYEVSHIIIQKTSLKNIEETRPTFSQSLVSTKVIDAANKSLKSKSRWVFI